MNDQVEGYYVVVTHRGSLYVTGYTRREDDPACFDKSWQAIGFFATRREARHFAKEISELTGMRYDHVV